MSGTISFVTNCTESCRFPVVQTVGGLAPELNSPNGWFFGWFDVRWVPVGPAGLGRPDLSPAPAPGRGLPGPSSPVLNSACSTPVYRIVTPERVTRARLLGEALRYASAAEEALIGGDLYDAVETPHGLRVIVGDVRGKGLDGVRLASVALGTFRDAAFTRFLLVDVVAAVDEAVGRYVGDEDFISAVLLELSGHEIRVVNLGHPSPLRYRLGAVDLLDPQVRSAPFGLSPTAQVETFAVATGERILLYTDGATECRDPAGAFFDLESGALKALESPNLSGALDALIEDLTRHCGGALSDDVALVLLAPRPPP